MLKRLSSRPRYTVPPRVVALPHMCSARSVRHLQMRKVHFDFGLCFLLGNLLEGLGKRWACPRHCCCRDALCSCILCAEAMAAEQWRLRPLRSELVNVELTSNGLAPYGGHWLLKALVPVLEIFDGIASEFDSRILIGSCRRMSGFFAEICSCIVYSYYLSSLYFGSSEYSYECFRLLHRSSLPVLGSYHSNWKRTPMFAASSHTQLPSS